VKEDSDIKQDLTALLYACIFVLITIEIAFYKEPFFNVIKFSMAFIYFSLLPGYAILLNFDNKFSTSERIIFSFPLGFAIYAICAYYLNMFVSLGYLLFLPAIIILISGSIYFYRAKTNKNKNI
jgi:uncharacterized membrane protein